MIEHKHEPQPPADPQSQFFEALAESLRGGQFIHLLLAGAAPSQGDLQRVLVRPITLKSTPRSGPARPAPHGGSRKVAEPHFLESEPRLSFTFRHSTRDETHNFTHEEGVRQIEALTGTAFRNVHLFTSGVELQLAFNRKGRGSLRRGAAPGLEAAAQSHDRDKPRPLSLSRPFVAALGLADAQGKPVPAMSRKWKQINKFIEVLAPALAAANLPETGPLMVADFGCGKAYLTFAVHDYLRHTLQRDAQVTGVELRADLVEWCNGIVHELALPGLNFEQGDLRHFKPRPLHVVIALHACDTATDHAIHLGLRAGAQVIVCSPCCHKQLRPQLLSPHALRPILQHGIHLGQEAEMLTDGLRALWLQAQGYATQVFEFVALEHTAKNKMILAVKGGSVPPRAEVLAQIEEVKNFYGIREQALETLLRLEPVAPV